jgi:hypothetical protein
VTAEEAEELAGKLSDRVEKLYRAGLLTYQEARNELKTVGEKYAAYSGIEPEAAPPAIRKTPAFTNRAVKYSP